MSGVVDYGLAKRAVLSGFRRGAVARVDICDGHPELMRAAKNVGRLVGEPCPVCHGSNLRQVRYVFGDELGELSGRVVYPEAWITELASSFDEFRCYTIDVCIDCSWNHLAACFLLGRCLGEPVTPARRAAGRSTPRVL